MAATNHVCFNAPKDTDIKIWRYMDFTKFVSLLQTNCLFLSRVDNFEDPYEGATSRANSKIRKSMPIDYVIPDNILKDMSHFQEWSRNWTYVNCWHMNNVESEAMWKLYAQTNEAIAIQSTYSTLNEQLPKEVYLGTVNYIDYEKDLLPEGNGFLPYVHKRLAFEHEKELRVLFQDFPKKENGREFDFDLRNSTFGKSIKINLNSLIEKILVAPNAPAWFLQIVVDIVAKYEFQFDVVQSEISKPPVF